MSECPVCAPVQAITKRDVPYVIAYMILLACVMYGIMNIDKIPLVHLN